MSKPEHVWAIAYIDRNFLHRVQADLAHYDYDDVECYIPTVRMLKKKFKGKDQFEFLPLLLNYGFFKIPYECACQPEWLMQLRTRIGAIYGWVKDPTKTLSESVHLRADNAGMEDGMQEDELEEDENLAEIYRNLPQCAIATEKEIQNLKDAADTLSIFSKEDIDRIEEGSYIVLKGYPFDNMPAQVLEINHAQEYVKVKLDIDSVMDVVKVSFENVFYTVYSAHDADGGMREESLESLSDRNKTRITDKLFHNINLNHGTD